MKRTGILLALLLLTGCGAPAADVEEPGPAAWLETEESPVISAPAVVTEGREPEQAYELPQEIQWMVGWDQTEEPVALLALTEDAALYGLAGEEDRVLVRWGDALAEFDWVYQTPQSVAPRLWQVDVDGDGEEELAAVCYYGGGTGTSIEQLHIVEKHGDGTLTDFRLPEDALCADALTEAIRLETAGERTFAILGRELVEITDFLEDAPPPQGIVSGDIIAFDVDPHGSPLHFSGSAWLEGEGYPPMAWYAVDLSAQVLYEDGTFTLSGLHLNSLDET